MRLSPVPHAPRPVPLQGFTLIEVVLVSATLAILVTGAVPRLQQTAHRLRVEQAAYTMAQSLRLARAQAVLQSRPLTWRWDANTHQTRIESAAQGSDAELGRDGPPLSKNLSVQVTRQGVRAACDCLQMFPDGTSEATTLILQAEGLAYTITVDDTTGETRVTTGRPVSQGETERVSPS
ncbi:MAG: GspH/FimT family pseudopilin [Candidatus Omnitrophica bacterium]|nr:GspH/FimT family pseudopilin [Candidatus Omnitrophota bacterium]